jgi:hypothetical protein
MRRNSRLTENDLSRIIRKVLNEQETDFDLKKTVMDTSGFEESDIPSECLGGDPNLSQIEMVQGCIDKITDKSTALTNTIKALSNSLSQLKN